MNNILQFLQESNGNSSSIRVLMLGYGIGILLVWMFLSIKSGNMVNIPDSVSLILGIVTSAKVISKPFENKPCEPNTPDLRSIT